MEISYSLLQHTKKNKNNQQGNYNQHEVENAGEKLGHLDLRTDL
jgi:hypothetical protein